jgi:hypothetical protein
LTQLDGLLLTCSEMELLYKTGQAIAMCAGFQDHDDTPACTADSQQLEDAQE